MCRFHQVNNDEKILLHDQLLAYAASVGGKNSFLKLIETIKKTILYLQIRRIIK